MSSIPPGMKPRLRDDVRVVEFPDGAYVHADSGTFAVHGAHAYAWLSRLTPALDGRRTVADLTTGLPGERRVMVERLLDALVDHHVVVDVRGEEPHALTAEELTTYADELGFIGF